MEVAAKYTGGAFNSIQLTFLRFLIGGLMLLPFAISDLKKRGHSLTAGDLGYLLFLGVISISISMTLLQVSMIGINANLAAIIICTNPLFTMIFAHFVADGKAEKGILCCGTGIGISMAANKVKGIRAAVVTNDFCAEMTRRHNDANILCMGGRVIDEETAVRLTKIFLETPFDGGRHAARIAHIAQIENGEL